MTFADFKNKVDSLMNIIYASGLTNHTTIIEQLNYLIFLRSLSKKDDQAIVLDPDAERIFTGELAEYKWDNLLVLNADTLFNTIDKLYKEIADLSTDKTIKLLYNNAHLQIADKPTLRRVIHEIEDVMDGLDKDYKQGHTDVFGDMYEHLLGTLSVAGRAGQYRTPRHLIKFIVDVVDPQKGETILDPSCGTAGFLVSALEHLKDKYTSEDFKKENKYPLDLLSPEERKFLFRHTLTGFDSDPSMFKFGLMNLYLHHLENPNIKRINTLVDTAGDRTKYDIILANPPFSGAIEGDSISEDLQMGTRATEILFLKYIADHLSQNGRAGVIVPEGVVFTNTNAHKKIRERLVEEGLWAVISLPKGVFLPYTPTKTSIFFFDKEKKNINNKIIFIEVKNDGFSLNAMRKPIDKNDLPDAKRALANFEKELLKDEMAKDDSAPNIVYKVVDLREIKNNNLNLSIDRYKSSVDNINLSKISKRKLKEVVTIQSGSRQKGGAISEGIPSIGGEQISTDGRIKFEKMKYITKKHFDEMRNGVLKRGDVLLVKDGATTGKTGYFDEDIEAAVNEHVFILRANEEILPRFLYNIIRSKEFKRILNPLIQGIIGGVNLSIGELEIPVPPIVEQKIILDKLEKHENLILASNRFVNSWEPEIDVDKEWGKIKLADILDYEQPTKYIVNSTNYSDLSEEYPTPVLTPGKTFILGYTKEKDGIYDKGLPVIIFDDFTTASRLINMPFKVKSSAMKILKIKNRDKADIRFVYYMMQGIKFKSETHKRYWISEYSQIEVPIPDLNIQKKIIAEIEKEQATVDSAKDMIGLYKERIQEKISEIWGKNEKPQ